MKNKWNKIAYFGLTGFCWARFFLRRHEWIDDQNRIAFIEKYKFCGKPRI